MAKKEERGLGKSFEQLMEDTGSAFHRAYESKDMFGYTEEEKKNAEEMSLEKIYPNPEQPRKNFDEQALRELADSIKKHGVIMPIVVNDDRSGRFMIIAGERRFRAAKLAGLKEIPVVIRNYSKREIKEISLIENLQREDLNPIEAAAAMKQLMVEYKLTQDELAWLYVDPALARRCLDRCLEHTWTLVTQCPDCYDSLAHIIYPLRYLRRDGHPLSLAEYEDRVRAIFTQVASTGHALEVNTCRGQDLADWPVLLDWYKSCGGEYVTLGSDAHRPQDLAKGIREAVAMVDAAGFRYLTTYEKRRPVPHKL